ncbi:glycosyltransferase family 2 protein [Alteromonas pelagimontana]|uniref:Glycosyltransferase family 2 protein n=1 Tax=Alteromonas pelagimontana TaxID=1858656 RepID=A0A6M4MH78_9ALTE|nr:glycosyltransferase family 2 protein [Alteromonas pelagimontana]QJR81536.1 glycosyltransferase family 2 protein [Alteromonas pelagimontana]
MKNFPVRVLKASFSLLPERLKNQLRKQYGLKAWYGERLRRSSLAYEVPSLRKIRKLLTDNLLNQKEFLCRKEAVLDQYSAKINVLIVGDGNVAATLKSLQCIDPVINTVWVDKHCVPGDCDSRDDFVVRAYYEDDARFTTKTLVIEAGIQLHQQLALPILMLPARGDLCYFDSISVNDKERLSEYRFLPDWNPDLQISSAYINEAVLLNTPMSLQFIDRFVTHGIAATMAYIYLHSTQLNITHQPFVLSVRKSLALSDMNRLSQELSGNTTIVNVTPGLLKVQWPIKNQPLVSLIIPTFNGKDLVKMCIESILQKTTYLNYEILLIDNNSDDPEALAYFSELELHPKIRLLRYPHPFNYSAINNFAVKHAQGEVIGLINNDIEVITPEWLEYMVGHAIREDIGCVGAKLLYPDDRIQHAGVVLGYGGGAGHAHKYFPRYHPGYMNRLIATQNYSAVTAACLLVKKSIYEGVGGLDEENLEVAFNDVDFCLRVLETGVRNLYCAEAELYHHESVSRGLDITVEKAARFNRELTYLQSKWKKYIDHDPAYNPNLTLKRENFAIKGPREYR